MELPSTDIVGIFFNPWKAEYDPRRSLLELYRRAIWLRSNPRTESYMKRVFHDRHPSGRFLNIAEQADWLKEIGRATTVVMLYPDAIGLRFRGIEAAVTRAIAPPTAVRVLNGRRREFVWSHQVRRELRLRRILEHMMAGELLAIFGFLVMTPFFSVSDFVRGRR